jgi:hypothetical protein
MAVTLLLSAWGNVIAACFCPRYHIDHEQHAHMQMVKQESSCNHDMSNMKMDNVEIESQVLSPTRNRINGMRAQGSSDHAFFQSPGEQCGHCLMFSAPTSATAAVIAVNPTTRLLETNAPLVRSEIASPSSFSITIDPSEHGPPGNLFPRHILISVFRI